MKPEAFILTCQKTTLVIYPDELLQRMPIDLLAVCIKRGKGYRRAVSNAARCEKTNTPWLDELDDLD